MIQFLIVLLLVLGLNTIFWASAGGLRVLASWFRPGGLRGKHAWTPPEKGAVAVLVAAHNEELVIRGTIDSAMTAGALNVFVASDGSSDNTASIARAAGASVVELHPNRGKAGAIVAAIDHFDLRSRFEVVLLLDADTQLTNNYLDTGLPLFADPEVVAVAGSASTLAHPHPRTAFGKVLVAYRERVYVAVQYLQKFGQAGRLANVVSIVPGFASMYRTRILGDIDIAAPGLTIEDYNMTFEVHAKRLGRIAFHPRAAVALTQDPDTLSDYVKQIRRWSLGFWQTVGRHGLHAGRFWAALALFITELLTSSLLMILFLPVLTVSLIATAVDAGGADATGIADGIAATVPPWIFLLGVLIPDFALTILAAVVARDPRFLLLGLAFPLVRILDALVCLRSLGGALGHYSDGTWKSPTRRTAQQGDEVTVPADAAA